VQIGTAKNSLSYGDPLAVDVHLTFEEPQMSGFANGVATVVKIDWLVLRVDREGSSEAALFPSRMPIRFTPRDSKGLTYGASMVVWCEVYKAPGEWIDKMVFDEPGDYKLAFLREGKAVSNTLSVQVEPSSVGEKGLSLMGPEARVYLLDGVYKSPETMATLREVVKECKGTTLGHMAAARLGLDYFDELERKRPDSQNFLTEYRKGEVKEPLFTEARKYLAIGMQLPVAFPIREKVVWQLVGKEIIENNYEQAFALLDDLSMNYPRGEYGKRAASTKEEVERFREQESAMAPVANVTPFSKSYIVWIIGCGAVLVAGVSFVIVLRKRRRPQK